MPQKESEKRSSLGRKEKEERKEGRIACEGRKRKEGRRKGRKK
jgi:hypothetical protein